MNIDCKVQMNMANTDSVRQDDLCRNEAHDKSAHGLFCVTGKDLELVNIDDLY